MQIAQVAQFIGDIVLAKSEQPGRVHYVHHVIQHFLAQRGGIFFEFLHRRAGMKVKPG